MEGKVTGAPHKDLTIGENWDYNYGRIYLWNIEYPLATGRSWSVFVSTDGANFSVIRSGTYTITDAAKASLLDRRPALRQAIGAAPSSRATEPREVSPTEAAGQPGLAGTFYINLDGWCDVLTLTIFPWQQVGEYDPACGGESASIGAGMEGKVTGVTPKDITLGENRALYTSYLYNIQYPLATGRSWSLYTTSDGINYTYVFGGTYTVVGAPAPGFTLPGASVRSLGKSGRLPTKSSDRDQTHR